LAESLKQAAESEKTLSELRTRLETVEKSSRHLEQVHTARIGDLEARNRELTARLKHLEAAEERVAELTALLKESHAQQEAGRNILESSGESAPEAPTELEAEVTSDDPPAAAARPTVREIADSDEPPANLIAGPVPEPLPKDSSAKAEPAAEAVKPTPAAEPPGPVTTAPPAKAGRRKKARRDPQMDLFAGSNATDDDFERPTVVAVDKDVAEAWPIELETEPSEVSEPNHNPEAATEPDTAPSAESKGADVLPEIKGLLVADGIAWAGGNPRIFLKSLREFSQQHTGTGDKIRAALEQGDAVAAEQMARGLKSSAGDIGASTLAESATTLARAIHDHAEPGDLEAAWSEVESQLHDLLIEIKTALKPKEEKAATRRLPAPPPLDAAQFRKAINLILPLLADSDPGARDCLKDNRNTFRSGFSPEGYADFELWVKKGDFGEALESLKKAARKHGLPV
jgi:HPt (histidine-containing phosphotransfer) domain-containing protein